jgi:hypothetical protein
VEDYQITLVANTPPAAGADILETDEGVPGIVLALKLLANDTDADSDALSITSVSTPSTAGGTVSLGAGEVSYTPAGGYSGSDAFTYVVNDGRGGTAIGTVTVTVRDSDSISANTARIAPSAGGFLIRFVGIPGVNYQLQWADGVSGPWNNLGSVTTATTLGIIEVEDTTAPQPNTRFYRIHSVP